MKRLILTLPYIAVLILSVLLFNTSQRASAASVLPIRCSRGVWRAVASPNPGTSTNLFYGVTALSRNNVWAVGAYGNGNGGLTLVEHWNGSQWSVVASPNVGGALSDTLSAVIALSVNNVWAVGTYQTSAYTEQTLIEHWNGTSWSIVASPNIPALSNSLIALSAVSAIDIWAVGNASGVNGFQTLIEHWNGIAWSIVPSPGSGQLAAVTALNAQDVWAVGSVSQLNSTQTLLVHWDGHKWSTASGINPSLSINTLNAVTAIAADNVWVVGDYTNSVGPHAEYMPLLEHWNGHTWSIVNGPTTGTSEQVSAITALSAQDIWIVGDYRNSLDYMGPYYTLTEHWNGANWSIVTSPSPGSIASDLVAVTAIPATNTVWAVGFTQGTMYQTLSEFRC